ncbi:acetylcholinesterase-like [Uranotaenia lowii]|uniref:acetylcholinesterase-like n=1 Tax=Uranotaenia lowii TaxID=190385 RepID=UPI00247ADB29|nr:acetylcholinesterase-like [Uranotaenia lowii]
MIYGGKDLLPNGNPYYYFKSIPYAMAPVFDLRFRSPVPLERFPTNFLDCTRERRHCMGMDMFTKQISGEEDGLCLHVYTPKLPGVKGLDEDRKLPVMVFLHGGGLMGGHGGSGRYMPDYILQEDVVVVTVNYRLGVLGFLCLPEAGIEGNAGLKDQRLALRWVHQNIVRFSGDPNNVTLFGESSGSISVHLHCLNKESKKYFHKGILSSGSVFSDFGHQEAPEEKARKMARLLGYDPKSDQEVLEILQRTPANKLVQLQFSVLSKREETIESVSLFPFSPVIETERSVDSIITKHPLELMKQPDAIGIPLIAGYNDLEGMIVLIDALKQLDVYNLEPERFLTRTLNVDFHSPEARIVGEQLRKFYFGDQSISRKTLPQLVDILSDKYIIAYPVIEELWSKYEHNAKLYGYRFSFDGQLNKGKALVPCTDIKGASHIDQVYYLFSSVIMNTDVPESSPAYQMRNIVVRMFTNFAKYGDPTPSNRSDKLLRFKWRPVENVPVESKELKLELLDIGDQVGMVRMPERKRMEFWNGLYEKYNGHMGNIYIPSLKNRENK